MRSLCEVVFMMDTVLWSLKTRTSVCRLPICLARLSFGTSRKR